MKKKKHPLTLLEIMVVIFIIGIIGTVVGVNMKGGLEQSKAFKSEKGSKQVYDILTLEMAKGDLDFTALTYEVVKAAISSSGLANDAKKLLDDGWGKPYEIKVTLDGSDVRVVSKTFAQFIRKKKKISAKAFNEKYPWMNPAQCRNVEKTA